MVDVPQLPDDGLRLGELLEAWARFKAGDPTVSLPGLRAQAGPLWPQLLEVVDMDEALAGLTGTATGELAGRFGRYQIVSRLGSGNFGTVYRARDEEGGREVALKVLNPSAELDESLLRRFKEEGRSAAQHPHIVQVHDSGTIDGRPYLAMEVMEGGGLDVLLDRLRALGGAADARWNAMLDDFGVPAGPRAGGGEGERYARRIAGLFAPLFGALGALKRAGVVNRDIKPQNLLFARDGRLKVSDFGIAHQADRTTLTGTVQAIGTLPYMSPEQAAGMSRKVTVAADVYSLGATLHEALALRPPLEGMAVGELLGAILSTKPASVREHQPHVPEDLAVVVARCLEKAPTDRPQDPEQVEFALQEIAAGRRGRIQRIPLLRRAARFVGRHRVGFGVGAGMLVAAGVALGIVLSRPAHITVVSPVFRAAVTWNGADVGPAPYEATVTPGHYVLGAVAVDFPDLFLPLSMPLDLEPGADKERALWPWKPINPEDPRLLEQAWSRRLGLEVGRLPGAPGTPRGGEEGAKVLCPRGDVGAAGLVLVVDGASGSSGWTYRLFAGGGATAPLFAGAVPAEAFGDGWPLPSDWLPTLRQAGTLQVELRGSDPASEPVRAGFRMVEGAALSERLASLPPEVRSELHPRLLAALAGLNAERAAEAYLECRALMREFPKNRLVLDTALEALVRLRLDDSAAYQALYKQRNP